MLLHVSAITRVTQPLNFIMTSLINHSQSVRYSHSLLSTSYWQCHLHTTLSVSWYLDILLSYFYIFFLWLLLHVNHVQPVCTFLSRTVMLILIFNSTAYCHAHSFILYILYFVLYILFFIHTSLVLYSTIFALSMERTWLTFHCWLYNICIVVYVTNKTWTWTWTWTCRGPFFVPRLIHLRWCERCQIF